MGVAYTFTVFTILFIVLLLSSSNLQSVAYLENDKSEPIIINGIPVVCSVEPPFSGLSENEYNELLLQAKISVKEWMVELQKGQEDNDAWIINYDEVSRDKEWNYSDTNCDIVIIFKDKPKNPIQHHKIGGLTNYDAINGKQIVTIYYLKTEICSTTDGVKIYFSQCYKNNLRESSQLRAIIQHEIGHALGLGHYDQKNLLIDLRENFDTEIGQSIMIETALDNLNGMKITPIDIENLRSLYGENGFN